MAARGEGLGSAWRCWLSFEVPPEPVTSAVVVIGAGAPGVYNAARCRHGGAKATARRSCAMRPRYAANMGIDSTTPAGQKIFSRMGYRPVTKIAVYSSSGSGLRSASSQSLTVQYQ
jgi:hypothetical protein